MYVTEYDFCIRQLFRCLAIFYLDNVIEDNSEIMISVNTANGYQSIVRHCRRFWILNVIKQVIHFLM